MPSADVSNAATPLALTVGSKRLPHNCTLSQRCDLLKGQGIPNESREIPRNPNPSGFQKFGLVELNKLDLSPFWSVLSFAHHVSAHAAIRRRLQPRQSPRPESQPPGKSR